MEEHFKSLIQTFSKIPTKEEFIKAFESAMQVITSALVEINTRVDQKLASTDAQAAKAEAVIRQASQELSLIVEETRAANETTIASLRKRGLEALDALFTKLRLEDRFNTAIRDLSDALAARVESLDAKILEVPVVDVKQLAIDAAALIPEKDATAEEVRDKLESLADEERLDASAIKNLPKAISETRMISVNHPLWQLADVDVSGILTGQSIKFDGTRWIPYTPVGGNSESFNEVAGGSGTTFTLANTPVAGTLRIYALGQRLVPTTDYSLSGTTITTVSSWNTGALTCDYEY